MPIKLKHTKHTRTGVELQYQMDGELKNVIMHLLECSLKMKNKITKTAERSRHVCSVEFKDNAETGGVTVMVRLRNYSERIMHEVITRIAKAIDQHIQAVPQAPQASVQKPKHKARHRDIGRKLHTQAA